MRDRARTTAGLGPERERDEWRFLAAFIFVAGNRSVSATPGRPPKGATSSSRCFGRLKDFRRIAMRYDKLAENFFSALCFVSIVAYWL